MQIKFVHEVEVTVRLDVSAARLVDRLLDLLEVAVARGGLTPEETAEVTRRVREQTEKLRGAAGGPTIQPTSPTT